MKPVKLEFILKGDIEKELKKVQLAMKGVGDESYTSFSRLLSQSDKAFNAMSTANQKVAISVQENINALRSLEADQKRLDGALQEGIVTNEQYAHSKAALVVQELNLRNAISSGMKELNERLLSERQAVDSVVSLTKQLQELTTTYYNLSKADREGIAGQGLIKQIQSLQTEIQKANQALREQEQVDNSAADSITRLSKRMQELTAAYNNLSKADREGAAGQGLIKQIQGLQTEIQKANQALREQEQVDNSAADSIARLSKCMQELTAAYYNLSKVEREGAAGQGILKQIGDLDKQITTAQSRLSAYSRTAGTGFNSLSMSVQQVARELPSLTMGANMFFLAISNNLPILADNLKQARVEYELMKKSGQTAIPVWKQVLSSVMSWQTVLVVGITLLTVYGKDLIAWTAKLFKSTSAIERARIATENLNKAREEGTKNAQEELTKLNLLYKAATDVNKKNEERVSAVKQLKELYPEHLKNMDNERIMSGDAADAYGLLSDNILKAAKARAAYDAIVENNKKIFELEQGLKESIDPDKGFWGWADKHVPYLSKNFTLLALRATHANRQIVGTFDEIKSLKESNRKLAEDIDVSDLEPKTPKGKKDKKDRSIEAANILKAETAMRELEIQRQKEALLQKEKDAELELRQQNINLLKDSADKELEQIALDYDRKINEIEKKGREYILARQKIEQAEWENANPDWKKKGLQFKPSTTSVAQLPASQGKELSDAALTADRAREKAEADLLEKTLKQYQDYATRRLEIEKKYNDDIAYLTGRRTEANKAAIDAAIAEAAKGKQKALSELSFDELKDTDMWTKMFGDLDKMAMPSLEALLKQAKEVNTSAWDPENVKEYQDAIDRLEETVKTRSPFKSIGEDWKKLLKGIKEGNQDDIADALSGIDTAAQKINGDLDTIAGGIGDIFGDEAGYAAEQVVALTSALGGFATGAAKIAKGDILGGIVSVVSSIGSIFSMGKKVKEMNRQAREEVQKYYDTAIEGEREYQLLLRERLRTQQEIGESSLAYNKRITAELTKQQRESAEEYARLMAEIQGEEYISGKGYKHGTWFRKAKTWDIYSSLAGKSYEDIEKLYTEGKLDEKVSKLFEQLKKLKEEGADIDQMLADQEEAMREALTGTTTDSIADSIIKGFAEGKRSAADFADDFQEMLNNAVLQGIKMKALEEPLRKWYESFAEASGNGLTTDSIADLKAQYDKIIEDAAKQLEDMEKITGTTIGDIANAGRTAVAKGIQSVSQDSFNEFMGSVNALTYITSNIDKNITDIQFLLYQAAGKWIEIEENTRYCRRLDGMDKDIREIKYGINSMVNKGVLIRKS